MCKCTYENCQFDTLLNGKDIYYFEKDTTKDKYCIFHAPEELKKNFTYYQNKLFKEIIKTYFREQQNIDFSSSVFHIPFEYNDFDLTGKVVNFTDVVFIEYFRMDNLKCEELIFQDTEFHDGGGIKNRGIERGTQINKLIYKPYQLESDFVIDIGRYANAEGLVETNLYGVIQKIQFENHKIGNGIIYFIGLNHQLEEGNFRNRILDNVSFQNCNLSRCYFLNAKVNETEFRYCEFPQQKEPFSYNLLLGLRDIYTPFIAGGLLIFLLYIMKFIPEVIVFELYIKLLLVLTIIIIFPHIYQGFNYFLSTLIKENSIHGNHTLNTLKFVNYHFCIADEKKILNNFNYKLASKEDKERIKDSLYMLETVYTQLKENFSNTDYQQSGNFFYSKRFSELLSSGRKDQMFERSILLLHHFSNGFGERFLKALFLFLLTIFIFAFLYTPNKDFIATDNTPVFLLDSQDTHEKFLLGKYYKRQFYDSNKSQVLTERKFKPEKLFESFSVSFIYSLNQLISPMISRNKTWFKSIKEDVLFFNYLETVLLYFFFVSFILALKNRIKR